MFKCAEILEITANYHRSLFWCFFSQAVFDVIYSTLLRHFYLSTVSCMLLWVHSAKFWFESTTDTLIPAPVKGYKSACFLLLFNILTHTYKSYFTLPFHHFSWYMFSNIYSSLLIALLLLISFENWAPKMPSDFFTFPSIDSQKKASELRFFVF